MLSRIAHGLETDNILYIIFRRMKEFNPYMIIMIIYLDDSSNFGDKLGEFFLDRNQQFKRVVTRQKIAGGNKHPFF